MSNNIFEKYQKDMYWYYGHPIYPHDDEMFTPIDGVTHNEHKKELIRGWRKQRKLERIKKWKSKKKRKRYYNGL